ncbi:hypothetical protein VNO77_03054 [Canavalia gladiata]|uniref:Uncharacterized protein n=1 Tax=Canavalia gladiata TaxID=3824 RepID=A0AAN9MZP6_CANGL
MTSLRLPANRIQIPHDLSRDNRCQLHLDPLHIYVGVAWYTLHKKLPPPAIDDSLRMALDRKLSGDDSCGCVFVVSAMKEPVLDDIFQEN